MSGTPRSCLLRGLLTGFGGPSGFRLLVFSQPLLLSLLRLELLLRGQSLLLPQIETAAGAPAAVSGLRAASGANLPTHPNPRQSRSPQPASKTLRRSGSLSTVSHSLVCSTGPRSGHVGLRLAGTVAWETALWVWSIWRASILIYGLRLRQARNGLVKPKVDNRRVEFNL